MADLIKLNGNIKNANKVYIGQKIKLPVSAKMKGRSISQQTQSSSEKKQESKVNSNGNAVEVVSPPTLPTTKSSSGGNPYFPIRNYQLNGREVSWHKSVQVSMLGVVMVELEGKMY